VRRLTILIVVAVTGAAWGQETLDAMLDRGYASDWLVCAPFPPDVEGGIVEALKRGEAVLGETDYMEPVRGVSKVIPKPGLSVTSGDNEVVWQSFKATEQLVDLSAVFGTAREGVAYAAFNVRAPRRRAVYFDVQSVLGVRMWLNGFPLREIRGAPASAGGLDRFLATFRMGANRVIMEVPMAPLQNVARTSDITARELQTRILRNRPMLTSVDGFQFALRLLPVTPLGDAAVIPRLESTGTFSGDGDGLCQDVVLTVFNPGSVPTQPISVVSTVTGTGNPVEQIILPIPPQSEKEAVLSLPVGGVPPGQTAQVHVLLTAGKEKTEFTAVLTSVSPPDEGVVYAVTGPYYAPPMPESTGARIERRIRELTRHLVLLENERDYGFTLGGVGEWRPFYQAMPDARQQLLDAVATSRAGLHAGYGTPDERIVGGETLARNLFYGYAACSSFLKGKGNSYYAWDLPGICPQTPQLLYRSDTEGLVSNADATGLPEIFWHVALDGSQRLHRRKAPSDGPKSIEELKKTVAIQRRELLQRGIDTDILVLENATAPPEPFFLGACTALARARPAVRFDGAGADMFFRKATDAFNRRGADVPPTARLLNGVEKGAVLAQPDTKRAHALVESQLVTAEKFATFASVLGAEYPAEALATAWRRVLFASAPERLGFATAPTDFLDALAAYRQAAVASRDVLTRATAYIAGQVNTYAQTPPRAEGGSALVVFNPCSWARTDVCVAAVGLAPGTQITLVDGEGNAVPFTIETPLGKSSRTVYLRFVATNVPALGYQTYTIMPRGTVPKQTQTQDAMTIENEFITLTVNPARGGCISSLIAKSTGKDGANGLLNDILAIGENLPSASGGRDLWTVEPIDQTSRTPAEVTKTVFPWGERLTVSQAFSGGTLVRELTLSAGVNRVECEARFEGVETRERVFAVVFQTHGAGRAPIYGERFGAVVGRFSTDALTLRTRGAGAQGVAAQPALRWAAFSPNDTVQAGLDKAVPLGPAEVIYGTDAALRQLAHDLVEALGSRGIPASSWPAAPRKLDPLWTDSTGFSDPAESLQEGLGMRIVVGGPEHNAACAALIELLPEETRRALTERIAEGAALYVEDETVAPAFGSVPTLLLAGASPEATKAVVHNAVESLVTVGRIDIAPWGYLAKGGAPQPATGLAILHEGSALANASRDGALVLGLAHDSQWQSGDTGLVPVTVPPDQTYRYAMVPFAGTWRSAALPRQAHAFNAPLVAAVTGLHLGQQPRSQSFLEPDNANFIVTAVKAAGHPFSEPGALPASARSGIIARGYESVGSRFVGRMDCFAGLRKAASRDLLESVKSDLELQDGRATFRAEGFAVETISLLPAAGISRGPETPLADSEAAPSPVFTRYWRHNTGVAPLSSVPLTLVLDGDLVSPQSKAQVTVVNNLSRETISGTVNLEVPAGWNIAPIQFDYSLRPGERVERQVVVLQQGDPSTPGGIAARTEYGGRTYRDVLAAGESPMELDITMGEGEVVAVIRNRGSLMVEGHLDLIAPVSHWPECGPVRSDMAYPSRAPISVGAFQDQRVVFRVPGQRKPAWLVGKLAANGDVLYQSVKR
jgi:alpha-mannosidase